MFKVWNLGDRKDFSNPSHTQNVEDANEDVCREKIL